MKTSNIIYIIILSLLTFGCKSTNLMQDSIFPKKGEIEFSRVSLITNE